MVIASNMTMVMECRLSENDEAADYWSRPVKVAMVKRDFSGTFMFEIAAEAIEYIFEQYRRSIAGAATGAMDLRRTRIETAGGRVDAASVLMICPVGAGVQFMDELPVGPTEVSHIEEYGLRQKLSRPITVY